MKYIVFLFLVGSLVQVHASENSSSEYSSYDDIVRELSSNQVRARAQTVEADSLESIRMHAAVGIVSSHLNLQTPASFKGSQSLSGAEVIFGIDLFSQQWMAEGAVRSYNPEKYADTDIQLKEFDLRIAHQDRFMGRTDYRLGAGMSARYLSFGKEIADSDLKPDYTTPASVFFGGLQTHLTPAIGIGAELTYRASLINDSIDRSAIDGSLRVTGTF